jgi:hypothetical protein
MVPLSGMLVALWEASDWICGKRLRVMIPTLLPSLERHGRLKLDQTDRELVLGVSAATIDRLLVATKIAAAGGKRRRVGFYSAVRREVPIRTFNDWHDPPPRFHAFLRNLMISSLGPISRSPTSIRMLGRSGQG